MTRKVLLIVLLISAVGLGCGCFSDDLCAVGGSFADDPNNTGIVAEFALPMHPQTAMNAVVQVAHVPPATLDAGPLHAPFLAVEEAPAVPSSSPVPIRC